jgi:hypothetical protein
MRIYFLAEESPTTQTAAAVHVQELLGALEARGHDDRLMAYPTARGRLFLQSRAQ